MTMKRYLPPLIPFLFTVPATVVAVRVLVSWYTDTHYTCSPYHPLWSSSLFLWVPSLGVLGLVSGAIFCWTPETPRALRWAGPGYALLVVIWSAWFFLHSFRLDWCV
jgi:uncharacterized BrkB/YihY/UPF0761 family membrane protein